MNIKMYWVGASTIVFDVDGVLKFAFDPCLVKEDSIVSFNSFDSKRVIPIHFNDFSHYETQEIELINGGYEVIERGKWLEV